MKGPQHIVFSVLDTRILEADSPKPLLPGSLEGGFVRAEHKEGPKSRAR